MKKILKSLAFSLPSLLIANAAYAVEYDSSLFGTLSCPELDSALSCWLQAVFNWSLGIVGSIAIVVIGVGGIIYTTSGGNPDQVAKGKSLITHALIGVGVLVLARFFITVVLGVPWLW